MLGLPALVVYDGACVGTTNAMIVPVRGKSGIDASCPVSA